MNGDTLEKIYQEGLEERLISYLAEKIAFHWKKLWISIITAI